MKLAPKAFLLYGYVGGMAFAAAEAVMFCDVSIREYRAITG